MKCIWYSVLLILSMSSATAEENCGSFRDTRSRSAVDFAPLPGYVDVCSQDFQLCTKLTQGYPPSVHTIGYFVLDSQWQRYKEGKQKGFTQYLIAQRGRNLSKEEFSGLKRYVHSQQGDIQDHSRQLPGLELEGKASLGVIAESDDLISFGAIIKLAPTEKSQITLGPLASINIALQLKGETLSLYVFDAVKDFNDTDRVKTLARRWVSCIRARNE